MVGRGDQVVVTGGAGFVGSHLVERLVDGGATVGVVDDFSTGRRAWLPDAVEVVDGDLADPDVVERAITPDVDLVFHLAADKDAARDDLDQFRSNLTLTQRVLERMTATGVDRIAFTSSSTVYGEAPMPTPEGHGPLEPISVYGAAKLASEGLLSVHGHSRGMSVAILRFANVVGPRLRGAVIPDFIEKLRADPTRLEILGDGRQEKSYLHVEDCVDAMVHVVERDGADVDVYNLGTASTTSVDRIASIVAEEMGLSPSRTYTGGRRGWTGDVPRMRLSIGKLRATGWEPSCSSDEAVRRATRQLLAEPEFGA